jgi:phage terminase large subunit
MHKQDFNITQAKKDPGSEFLKSHDIIVHPDGQHCIDELSLYSYKTDKLVGRGPADPWGQEEPR